MARLRDFVRRLARWLIIPSTVATLLFVLGVLIVAGAYLYHHCECQSWPNLIMGWEPEFEALYANFATTLIGIAIAVFTIDRANERRAEQQLKAQLIREMGSKDNGIASRAVQELRILGSVEDGTLQGVDLIGANLQGANLGRANLQGAALLFADLEGATLAEANLQKADLYKANLHKAILLESDLQGAEFAAANLQDTALFLSNLQEARHLTDEQLVRTKGLLGTIMPTGSLYDGRFNLVGDIELAVTGSIDLDDPEAMANFYGVSLEAYLAGQEWSRENLPKLLGISAQECDDRRERTRREVQEKMRQVQLLLRSEAGSERDESTETMYDKALIFARRFYRSALEQPQEDSLRLGRAAQLEQASDSETEGARQLVEPVSYTSAVPTTAWRDYTVRRLREKFLPFGRR